MNTSKIIWAGIEYDSITKFDCHVVKLTYHSGGSYMTVIPISPLDYREKNPTKAKVVIHVNDEHTIFNVYCDWGKHHIMRIPNHMKKEIQLAKQSAIDMELLKETKALSWMSQINSLPL